MDGNDCAKHWSEQSDRMAKGNARSARRENEVAQDACPLQKSSRRKIYEERLWLLPSTQWHATYALLQKLEALLETKRLIPLLYRGTKRGTLEDTGISTLPALVD